MKKFLIVYALMLALTVGIPIAVCFINKGDESGEVVNIFHSAVTVIDALVLLK